MGVGLNDGDVVGLVGEFDGLDVGVDVGEFVGEAVGHIPQATGQFALTASSESTDLLHLTSGMKLAHKQVRFLLSRK